MTQKITVGGWGPLDLVDQSQVLVTEQMWLRKLSLPLGWVGGGLQNPQRLCPFISHGHRFCLLSPGSRESARSSKPTSAPSVDTGGWAMTHPLAFFNDNCADGPLPHPPPHTFGIHPISPSPSLMAEIFKAPPYSWLPVCPCLLPAIQSNVNPGVAVKGFYRWN